MHYRCMYEYLHDLRKAGWSEAGSVGNATGKGGGGGGKVREHKGSHHAINGAESDGNDSEGSDLVAEDSEEELETDPSKEGGGTDARRCVKFTQPTTRH